MVLGVGSALRADEGVKGHADSQSEILHCSREAEMEREQNIRKTCKIRTLTFPPPKSRIKHPRACGSSARRSLADASVSHCRTVVRPLQRMRLERDADDNRTALITPSNARFTDLGMLVSRLTFIQQRSYDRRCRTSHSCQFRTSFTVVDVLYRPWRQSYRNVVN
jgi:hypothetical protein